MKDKAAIVTRTVQPRSWVSLGGAGGGLTADKPEAEDTMSLLLSLYGNLNALYEILSGLSCKIEKKARELEDYRENNGDME